MANLVLPRSSNEIPVVVATRPGDDLLSIGKATVLGHFTARGVILFRSFSVGIDSFRAMVAAYSNQQIAYPGSQRSAVSQDGRVQTVAAGTQSIPLHSELSHTPFRPDICWFYCVRAPAEGSETTLCDGAALVSALPADVRDNLHGRMLRYRRTRSIGYLARILGTRDTAAVREFLDGAHGQHYRILGDQVRQDFRTPALPYPRFLEAPVFANNILHNFRRGRPLRYPTFGDGSVIPETLILQIRQIARQCTLEVKWRDGDLLMFDNTRFMHGRRRIVDRHRTIWTQFSNAAF
jgi:alpha-ketoglutarate-dependent taurine dioxygenase